MNPPQSAKDEDVMGDIQKRMDEEKDHRADQGGVGKGGMGMCHEGDGA